MELAEHTQHSKKSSTTGWKSTSFRKAMLGGWCTDQVKTCKSIEQAWGILDVEFEDKKTHGQSFIRDKQLETCQKRLKVPDDVQYHNTQIY